VYRTYVSLIDEPMDGVSTNVGTRTLLLILRLMKSREW